MTILWRDSMKIGDETLDAEHKKFIAMLNLTERGLQQKDVAPATEIFDELQIYVEGHFPAEEAYMERLGCPDLEAHRKQHEALAYRFYVLLGRFRAAVNDAERRRHVAKLAEFLREWLIEHILKEIVDLKPFREPQAGEAAMPWPPPTAALVAPPTPTDGPPAATETAPATSSGSSGEWRSTATLPAHLEKYVRPLEYVVPRPPMPTPHFASFRELCESAIWRSINKTCLFFQRRNETIVRELPPLFIASPEFARNLKRVIENFIFPAMWESRRMRMLLTNFNGGMSDDEAFFDRLGERNSDHILTIWSQTWNALRLVEGSREAGLSVMRVKEDTRKIRDLLQPSTPIAYDLPKVGNREIEIFKGLLDPANDWWHQLNRRWKSCHDYYIQEKTPMGDPDIREGTLRDALIEIFNSLPDPWGDFFILTAHRAFPRLDCAFLESFVTNFGRTEVAREAVMPYTMRYLRQSRADPDLRARELAEEEAWQKAIIDLRQYRRWRSSGGFM